MEREKLGPCGCRDRRVILSGVCQMIKDSAGPPDRRRVKGGQDWVFFARNGEKVNGNWYVVSGNWWVVVLARSSSGYTAEDYRFIINTTTGSESIRKKLPVN